VARDLCPVPAARSGQAEAAEAISIAQAIVAGVLAAADRYFSETQKDIILNAIPAGYRPSLEGNDPRRSKVVVPSNSGDPHPDLTKATILAGLGKQPGAFRVVNAGSDDTGVLLSIIPGNLSKDRLLDYLQLVRGVPPEKVVVYADGGLQTKALLRGRVATVSSSADAVNINLIASARSDYAAVATSDTALMTRGASGKLDPNAAEMLYQLLLAGKSVAITTELGERDLRLMVSDLKDWVTTAKKSPALTPEQYSNLIFGTTGSAVITDATKIAPDITGTPRVGA
jgi:hypothetical protein